MSIEAQASTKTWELSFYELHRTPQEALTDNTEIAVSPRSLHSELMCPICLDMLKHTMTTKECLHRFCHDCIITALRSGNKECPTCRKKLVSKRSLRPDPNFDALISKIYPSRDEYEAHQERVLAKLNKQISTGDSLKAQKKKVAATGGGEPPEGDVPADVPPDIPGEAPGETPAEAPSETSGEVSGEALGKAPNETLGEAPGEASVEAPPEALGEAKAEASGEGGEAGNAASHLSIPEGSSDVQTDVDNAFQGLSLSASQPGPSGTARVKAKTDVSAMDITDLDDYSEVGSPESMVSVGDVELIFKPHPEDLERFKSEQEKDQKTPTYFEPETADRYIKTTGNATVDHLSKYLAMRIALDRKAMDKSSALGGGSDAVDESSLDDPDFGAGSQKYTISISTPSDAESKTTLNGNWTLEQVHDKYWKSNKPLEMYYKIDDS